MNPVNDILYPECHLDSPIVAGKLIMLASYSNLPLNQKIEDETLLRNIRINKRRLTKSPTIVAQEQFKVFIESHGYNINKWKHIPYPYGNDYLFHLTDINLINKLENLIKLSHSSYAKISERLVQLQEQTETKLGLTKNSRLSLLHDEYNKNSIRYLHLKFEGSCWFKPFLFWFALKTDMRDLIKRSPRGSNSQRYECLHYNLSSIVIFMNRNLIVIYIKTTHQVHYLTFEMVLMLSDVTEGRLMIDVAMNCDYRYFQFKEHGKALWKLIDSLFCDLGNETYNIVALIEPLTLGYLQLKDKSPYLKGAFLKYVLDELVNEFKTNGYDNDQDVTAILQSVTKIFMIDDIHMIAEFFSFFRTFGHPILEASNAAAKVREHMLKPKVISFQVLMKGHALFCGFIINGFRDRHGGSWPPVILPSHASNRIKTLYNNNESLSDEDCIREWKSFVGFQFKCFLPLTLDDDLTMFMKDKALAAIKSEWDSVYPKEGMIYNPPKQTTSRRLVDVFLDDDKFDPVHLINYVLSGEYLDDPEFNLSYSLKEKEIKKVGRLFAKMPYKMRACQVVAESLIANGVGKYFKENGMSKDEHELLQTLHKLSVSSVPRDNKVLNQKERNKLTKTVKAQIGKRQTAGSHFDSHRPKADLRDPQVGLKIDKSESIQYEIISTFLTTDLQKFCLNWRQESSNIFAERLNEIYGLPRFFGWMHPRLEQSVLYVADPNCPPYVRSHIDLDDVENDQIFIKYPMGGIEGYCQKLWTIITIPFLFLSAYEVGTRIAAVVQGDNQAIAITRRVHPNLPYRVKKIKSTRLAQRYFNQLRLNLGAIGHNLKANETIVSSHFFVYSKRIYFDGLALSQALKPMSRVVFWSETIVDETRSACSNISTAIAKSVEQGYSRWIGYSLNVLKTLQQLLISLEYTINPNMTKDIVEPLLRNQSWLLGAALIPSQLGGFNYLNMCRLYVRNIGDPAVASIADVKRLIKANLLNESILNKILHQQPGNSTYLDWASDPYSLNIPDSQPVTVMLKNITARTILQNSNNPMLHGLFHLDFEQEDRDLATFLMDRPIIIPRAAHEIMGNSLTGARQELAGMLDTTKGLIRNSIRLGGVRPRLIDKLTMYDYEQFRIFNEMMKVNKTNVLYDVDACSVHLTINLRKRMWAHLTHGRSIYGLEVPDTIEVCNGYLISGCDDCYYCVAGSLEFGWFFVPRNCELDSVSKESNSMRVPYFGSTTDERSEIKLSSVKSPSRALKSAVRIAMVYTWAYGDTEESWLEAWYLASFRANVTIDELQAITPISTSNNIAHRLRDRSTQVKYSGSATNRVGRYTVISNDHLNFIVDGVKLDTNLVYQQTMLMGLSILEDRFRFCSQTTSYNTLLHLHINTNCCIVEMNDHPYVESERVLPVLQKVDCNKLIYDDDPIIELEQTRIQQQLFRSSTLDFPSWDYQQLQVALCQSLALTIIEIITREHRDHLNEFKVLSNDDSINSLITEFLLVDPNLFTLHLGQAIAINWSYDIYYRRPEGKYQMLEFIDTILITSCKGNLTVLNNAFSHNQVFMRFWDCGLVEPIYGPNLNQQDYTKMSIDYLTLCYHTYINHWLDDNTCEYMITEAEEEIVDQRFEITQARHLCFLSCLYLSREEMAVIRGLTSIEKCSVLHSKLDLIKNRDHHYLDWNTDILPVVIYPSSLTYIRRGTIKHIKLRNYLSSDAIGYTYLNAVNAQPRVFDLPSINIKTNELYSYFFPLTSLISDDFADLDYKPDITYSRNRWEIHVLRRVGLNSTSCYKAVEIGQYIKELVNTKGKRLFLGEGSGAMMAVYYLLLGPSQNFYNTGVSENNTIGQRVLNVSPSEYHIVAKNNPESSMMINDLTILFNGKPESTWIGNNDSFKYIMNTIENFSIDLIHSDMESSFSKDAYTILMEQLHILCLAVNLGTDQCVLVTKLAPYPGDYSAIVIQLHTELFESSHCFLPAHSNPYSSELYIVSRSKKVKTLITPDVLMRRVNLNHPWLNVSLYDIIINIKIKRHNEVVKEKKYYDDYLTSDLYSLSMIEKTLISSGFKVNGPKVIKRLIGHDISTGEANFISSINVYFNHLVNLNDNTRDVIPFFDPYPLLEQSKLSEMMYILAKKLIAYFILYGARDYDRVRRNCIRQIRTKQLSIDLTSNIYKRIIQNHIMKRFRKLNIKTQWVFEISTVDIKNWWKLVGYSLLIIQQD